MSNSAEGNRLRQRLDEVAVETVATTVITLQEHAAGWLAAISSAKRTTNLIAAYRRLLRLLLDYEGIEVHPFDDSAATQFEQLRQDRVRIGTLDLRIASIALARKETLLTRNTRDFSKVPGLQFENWTR